MGACLCLAGQFLIGCGSSDSVTATADPKAEIVLENPLGGETFKVGETLRVKWKAQGKGVEEIHSVTVALSPDSGMTWIDLKRGSISEHDEQWGNYPWVVEAKMIKLGVAYALAGKSKLLIRVQDYVNTSDTHKAAYTPKVFSIAAE